MKTFFLEILTPDKNIFKGEVESTKVDAITGKMGILANHVSLCTMLKNGKIQIKLSNGDEKLYDCDSGVLIIKNNHVSIHLKEILN